MIDYNAFPEERNHLIRTALIYAVTANLAREEGIALKVDSSPEAVFRQHKVISALISVYNAALDYVGKMGLSPEQVLAEAVSKTNISQALQDPAIIEFIKKSFNGKSPEDLIKEIINRTEPENENEN